MGTFLEHGPAEINPTVVFAEAGFAETNNDNFFSVFKKNCLSNNLTITAMSV